MKPILTAIIVSVLLFSSTKILAQVNVQDSLALVDLYDSTNGQNWTNQTNWLTSAPVSTWYGVTTISGRVSDIHLADNKLNGYIPSSLHNLHNLIVLVLVYNHLTGNIPPSLGNLSNLQDLGLNGNQLSGNVPSSLGNLSNLHVLTLDQNQLSGNIPSSLGNLSNYKAWV
ncbi:MAG: hypothetical protein ACR2FN_02765 [Chitinophagaceae bacterium]